MLMAVVDKRRQQELVPVAELDAWNAQMKSELSKQGREDFHERLAAIAHRARQLDALLVRTAREDEGWWWRWILGHCEQNKIASFPLRGCLPREKHQPCCTKN